MCELYKSAKQLAAKKSLVLLGQCPIEIDCNGVNCSVAHLGEDVGGDGLVQYYEGAENVKIFYDKVEKSVVVMQANR